MSQVTQVTMYACPRCERTLKTERGAQNCLQKHLDADKENQIKAEEAKKREERRHVVRLEAETHAQIFDLLKKYAKEYYDLDITFTRVPNRLGSCSNTHNAPIGMETNWHRKPHLPDGYLGWSGRWEGTITGRIKEYWATGETREKDGCFTDVVGSYSDKLFAGLHTGTGSGGRKFSIDGTIFLDDFPKIKAKYDEYQKFNRLKQEQDNRKQAAKDDFRNQAWREISNTARINELNVTIWKAKKELEQAEVEVETLQNEIHKKYNEMLDSPMGKALWSIDTGYDEKRHKELAEVLRGNINESY